MYRLIFMQIKLIIRFCSRTRLKTEAQDKSEMLNIDWPAVEFHPVIFVNKIVFLKAFSASQN